jgi:tetrahydromethanopterin S-methyltransferase subunit E
MKYVLLPSTRKHKKYMAVFLLETKRTVHFGDNRYQQYKDSTGLGKYTHLNHGDAVRRHRYYQRHGKNALKYSAKYFSHKYLW